MPPEEFEHTVSAGKRPLGPAYVSYNWDNINRIVLDNAMFSNTISSCSHRG